LGDTLCENLYRNRGRLRPFESPGVVLIHFIHSLVFELVSIILFQLSNFDFQLAGVIVHMTASFDHALPNILRLCSPQIPKGVQHGQLLVLRGKG